MTIEIPDAAIVEGVARAAETMLASEQLIERVVDAICQRFELVPPDVAAAILGKTPRTLADNHIEWGLDKSVAFGATNPLYFLSQVIERAREKVVKASKAGKPVPFTTGRKAA